DLCDRELRAESPGGTHQTSPFQERYGLLLDPQNWPYRATPTDTRPSQIAPRTEPAPCPHPPTTFLAGHALARSRHRQKCRPSEHRGDPARPVVPCQFDFRDSARAEFPLSLSAAPETAE